MPVCGSFVGIGCNSSGSFVGMGCNSSGTFVGMGCNSSGTFVGVVVQVGYKMFLGELKRIAFRLMLSSCVSVCVLSVCLCVYAAFVDIRKTV